MQMFEGGGHRVGKNNRFYTRQSISYSFIFLIINNFIFFQILFRYALGNFICLSFLSCHNNLDRDEDFIAFDGDKPY